jgi:hypothetical protein
MFQRKITLLITISIYILFVGLLFVLQPAMMFDKEGNIKQFNFNWVDDTTLIPLVLALPLLAVVIYLLVLVVEMIMT